MNPPEQLALVGENGRALAPEPVPTSAMTLMERAIDRGMDVGVLTQLMDLQERMDKTNARKAFFDAVTAFQDECPEIRKAKKASIQTSTGGSYSYTYAPLEEITRTIRPILKKHGLAYSWDVVQSDERVLNVVCRLRHIDGHEEQSGFPVPLDTKAKMSGAQQHGAALTYGRRQSLIAVLGLTTADEDNDAPRGRERTKTITKEQVRTLDDIIEANEFDKAGFLEWLGGVGSDNTPIYTKLSDILATDYKRALLALEERAQEANA